MSKTRGDIARFLAIRADTMARLVSSLGGHVHEGGPVVELVRRERAVQIPVQSKAVDNWIVDGEHRALAYMVEILQPERLELKVCIYDDPRHDYLNDPRPLFDSNPQIDLTST